VDVNSIVGVGAGVSVTGTNVDVGEAGIVNVGGSVTTEVGALAAAWQAVRKRRHPRKSFFMALIKT
jgi:hypothetical protein